MQTQTIPQALVFEFIHHGAHHCYFTPYQGELSDTLQQQLREACIRRMSKKGVDADFIAVEGNSLTGKPVTDIEIHWISDQSFQARYTTKTSAGAVMFGYCQVINEPLTVLPPGWSEAIQVRSERLRALGSSHEV
ncbi:hypothetical protein [Reinekea sp. G2M2-21]|uniref:hypothetical protein n=1 Tax=Reinekea sp. G2M2-21 TaxID=2788942 RepID=UPI0018AB4074|nr:hypothetical protein [Reinekea sp. G2M2-21]